jgi:uncharacterized protein YndB with AHSA1/START domain
MVNKSKFVYVTYISATPEKIWNALLDAKFTRQYWGHDNVSDWKPGSKWEHRRNDEKHTVDPYRRSSRKRAASTLGANLGGAR